MQVTIIPIVIGAFRRVTKALLKGLEVLEIGGLVETIQATALLKTATILRSCQRNRTILDENMATKNITKGLNG